MSGAATIGTLRRTSVGIALLGLIVLVNSAAAAEPPPITAAWPAQERSKIADPSGSGMQPSRAPARILCSPIAVGKGPAAKQTAAPTNEAFAALVRQLGDPSYQKRCEAAARLTKCGLAARDPLRTGLQNPDLEIRRSCRRLLAGVLEDDFRSRLEALAADTEGKREHDIPCWSRFREVYGTDRVARKLFVEMQRFEPALMESAEVGDELAKQAFTQRLQQAVRGYYGGDSSVQRQLHLATFAALLFVAVDSKLRLPEDALIDPMQGNMLFYQPSLQQRSAEANTRRFFARS